MIKFKRKHLRKKFSTTCIDAESASSITPKISTIVAKLYAVNITVSKTSA